MEKDLDTKLYNEYLNGEKEAFELLYNKYKNKIQYFMRKALAFAGAFRYNANVVTW